MAFPHPDERRAEPTGAATGTNLPPDIADEIIRLRERLWEAESALDAIRSGGVDSLIIGPPGSKQIYTLSTADRPYRIIVDGMGEGAATVSTSGVILYANARLAAMVGRSPGQLVGRPALDLTGANDRETLRALLEVPAGNNIRGQLDLDGADGSALPVLVSVSGLDLDSAGLVRCLIATDLTSQRQAETARTQAAELEQRVAARTAELAATTSELEQFVRSVSHDLRAPLRAITGFSQTLLDEHSDGLSERGRQCAERLQANGQQMTRLLEAMLQLSRVSRTPMRVELVDLTRAAHDIVTDLQERDPGRRVTFDIQDGLVARADAALIGSVLQNLLDNAWKFTAKRESAHIEFGMMPVEDASVGYFVRDNGVGFDPRRAGRLFQPFQRLHSDREFAGTGMGLTSVRRIIARHGGRVWAVGARNQGATVCFTLGSTPQGSPPSGSDDNPRSGPDCTASNGSGHRRSALA